MFNLFAARKTTRTV